MARTRSPKPSSPRPKRPLSDSDAPTARREIGWHQKKIPARQCQLAVTSRPKRARCGWCAPPSGEISIDPVGKKPGRGAYLCPDAACLAKAKKKKALERCFEQPVPAEVYDALARQLAAPRRFCCLPRRRSWSAVCGPWYRDGRKHPGASCHGQAGTGPAGPLCRQAGQQRDRPLCRRAVPGHLPACRTERNVVFGQGVPTAEVLFVGEGPGQSEDEQGLQD
mgnify:CR=1 FL=1